uniref:Transmembrane channel-like protein n=1 Tax=Latimeria chalumnae TaxID=7897 RepID=M3XGP9_LATCH|nr:PREDICTED: transmembrane channel-like protein 7 isoform X1 [Latimeria chalumnae]|eukprot:XP_006006996.1 PREDICTED: transmembrane channel-like protein 7 isoform X1 [Latimeria chalumnae]
MSRQDHPRSPISGQYGEDQDNDVFLSDRRVNPFLQQLPSYQSLLKRTKSTNNGTRERRKSTIHSRSSSLSTPVRSSFADEGSDDDEQSIREYAISLKEKRKLREKKKKNAKHLVGWHHWKVDTLRSLKRFQMESLAALSVLKLWKSDIHEIEGRFGTGIKSYFLFLRFLVLLNAVIFLLMFGFVTLPVAVSKFGIINATYTQTNKNFEHCATYGVTSRGLIHFYHYIIDMLSGTGFLERTYLFYGYYKLDAVQFVDFKYNVPLAYLMVTIAYLFISLVWIVRRSVLGFKSSLVHDEDRFQTYCNKIFAGWDFCITDPETARLKHNSLHQELKTDLEEERIRKRIAARTKGEKIRIYLIRFLINSVVLSLLVGCFYCVYKATIYSQEYIRSGVHSTYFLLDLATEYLPSLVITFANVLTPPLFDIIIQFEDYSPAFEIRLTLMRSVFLRLASITILMFTLWSQITLCPEGECSPCGYNYKVYPCWESRVGQEMYKLMIFDFIVIMATTLFYEYPRKLIVTHWKCKLTMLLGQQEFDIPQNVLYIVYGQTICWIGAFYSPLLPAIATVKYFFTFYIKKTSLMTNCRPATRIFRASSSNFFFLLVLLIGLVLACIPVGVSIGQIHSSKACGPFVNFNTSWEVIPHTIKTFPTAIQRIVFGLGSEAFAIPFFFVVCLILFYFVALAGAHKQVVEQLREQLAMEGRDKLFLIRKLTQAQIEMGTKFARAQMLPSRTSGREKRQVRSESQSSLEHAIITSSAKPV